jgi:predicted hydrolase (HD superfamily)
MLKEFVSADVIRAVKAHNFEHTAAKPETRMEKALVAADAVSGLLIACA